MDKQEKQEQTTKEYLIDNARVVADELINLIKSSDVPVNYKAELAKAYTDLLDSVGNAEAHF